MIKRPKRLLALTMGLALLLGTLAGCNSTPSASSTGTDGAQSSGASASEGGETGGNADRETVNIRFSQYANSTDDAEGMANDPIKKAIEEKVNVTLEYDTGIEGYDDRLATEVAVGAAPDLFPTWGSAATLKKYAEEEAVWNIAEIINAEPDRYPILHKIINSDEYKMYNKMYTGDENAAYAIYSFSARAYPAFSGVPAYNTAILEEVNDGKVPSTVDEFIQFTQNAVDAGYSGWWPYNNKLTNWAEIDSTIARPNGTSLRTPATYDWLWTGLVPDDEAAIGTADEHWTLMTVSDESKEVVRTLASMYANNQIHNGVGTLVDEDDGYAAFNNESLASYGYGYGYYTQFKKLYDSWMNAHPDDGSLKDLTLGTALQGSEGWMKLYDVPVYVGAHYFIPTSCEYPDRVLDLVEFLASNEGQELLFRGIEGLTYTMDGENVVYNIDEFVNINKSYGYPNPDRCRYMWFSYLFCASEMMLDLETNDWWTAVTTPYDNTLDWAEGETKEAYQYALDTVAGFVDNVYVELPSYYGLAVLDSEWANTQTTLVEISNRYLAQMMGGQLDIDTGWEQYRAEFNQAGGPELEQAINDAIAYARETYGT
ncbi:extracellular solute-binding protein [Anaeromassilibacillus sp. An200]|uniref:extracellular solute-binding protein n=1 Tax=Anaeromassilibacillus sp. An200 TaxID=1965587 RepID=UPI0013A67BD4|nr:extracellular solute-binding protein [Anaeromassilibacillus sp. An200]